MEAFDDFPDDVEASTDFMSPSFSMPAPVGANTQPMPNKQLRFSGAVEMVEELAAAPAADVAARESVAVAEATEDAVAAGSSMHTAGEVDAAAVAALPLAGAGAAAAPKSNEVSTYIKSFLRVRPLSSSEAAEGAAETITIQDRKTVVLKAPQGSHAAAMAAGSKEHTIAYSGVFDRTVSQRALFDETVCPVLSKAVEEGANGLVFAYGMTNAGKTYTISGKGGAETETAGVLPRALDRLFDLVAAANAGAAPGAPVLVLSISYVEIYNDSTYDLLPGTPMAGAGAGHKGAGGAFGATLRGGSSSSSVGQEDARPKLHIAAVGPPHVKGARQWYLPNKKAADKVLASGAANKTHAETALNSDSSRSHAVFTVAVYRRDPAAAGPLPDWTEPTAVDIIVEGKGVLAAGYASHARLSIVDLAGSESQKRTGATGAALKEAGNINRSLMFLQQCFKALKDTATSGSTAVPPYRSCQLTLLLRDSLQGSAAGDIVMIVCGGPGAKDYDETRKAVEWGALMKETRVVGARALSKWTESDGVDANGRRIVKGGAKGAAAAAKVGGGGLTRGDSAASGLSAASSLLSGMGSTLGGTAGSKRPRTDTSDGELGEGLGLGEGGAAALAELRTALDIARGEAEAARAEAAASIEARERAEAAMAEARASAMDYEAEAAELGEELARSTEALAVAQGAAAEAEAAGAAALDECAGLSRANARLQEELADKEDEVDAIESEVRAEMVGAMEERIAEKDAGWKARAEKVGAEVGTKLLRLLALQEARAVEAGAGGKGKGAKGASAASGAASARAALATLLAQVGFVLPVGAVEGGAASQDALAPSRAPSRARGRSTMGTATTEGEDEDDLVARSELVEMQEALTEAEDEVGRVRAAAGAREAELKAAIEAAKGLQEGLRAAAAAAEARAVRGEEARLCAVEATAVLAAEAATERGAARDALAGLTAHCEGVEREVDELTARCEELERDLATASASASAAEAAHDDNASTIDSYRAKIATLEDRLATLTRTIEPMQAREAAALAREATALATAAAAQAEAEQLRGEGAVAMVPTSDLSAAKAEVAAVRKAAKATEVQLSETVTYLLETQTALAAAEARVASQAAEAVAWGGLHEKDRASWAAEKAALVKERALLHVVSKATPAPEVVMETVPAADRDLLLLFPASLGQQEEEEGEVEEIAAPPAAARRNSKRGRSSGPGAGRAPVRKTSTQPVNASAAVPPAAEADPVPAPAKKARTVARGAGAKDMPSKRASVVDLSQASPSPAARSTVPLARAGSATKAAQAAASSRLAGRASSAMRGAGIASPAAALRSPVAIRAPKIAAAAAPPAPAVAAAIAAPKFAVPVLAKRPRALVQTRDAPEEDDDDNDIVDVEEVVEPEGENKEGENAGAKAGRAAAVVEPLKSVTNKARGRTSKAAPAPAEAPREKRVAKPTQRLEYFGLGGQKNDGGGSGM